MTNLATMTFSFCNTCKQTLCSSKEYPQFVLQPKKDPKYKKVKCQGLEAKDFPIIYEEMLINKIRISQGISTACQYEIELNLKTKKVTVLSSQKWAHICPSIHIDSSIQALDDLYQKALQEQGF